MCHPSGMRLSQACVLSAAPHPMQGRIPLRPGQFQRCPAETCSKHQAAPRHNPRELPWPWPFSLTSLVLPQLGGLSGQPGPCGKGAGGQCAGGQSKLAERTRLVLSLWEPVVPGSFL